MAVCPSPHARSSAVRPSCAGATTRKLPRSAMGLSSRHPPRVRELRPDAACTRPRRLPSASCGGGTPALAGALGSTYAVLGFQVSTAGQEHGGQTHVTLHARHHEGGPATLHRNANASTLQRRVAQPLSKFNITAWQGGLHNAPHPVPVGRRPVPATGLPCPRDPLRKPTLALSNQSASPRSTFEFRARATVVDRRPRIGSPRSGRWQPVKQLHHWRCIACACSRRAIGAAGQTSLLAAWLELKPRSWRMTSTWPFMVAHTSAVRPLCMRARTDTSFSTGRGRLLQKPAPRRKSQPGGANSALAYGRTPVEAQRKPHIRRELPPPTKKRTRCVSLLSRGPPPAGWHHAPTAPAQRPCGLLRRPGSVPSRRSAGSCSHRGGFARLALLG